VSVDALRAWKADPARMVRDLFQVEPDAWQLDALAAFATGDPAKRRVALQACAGPGKSTVLAWCGWNFMLCYSDGVNHPNGAVVSITSDNLKNGLWKELAVWYGRSPLLMRAFDMTAESIFAREHQKTWFLNFRSFAKAADTEAQGRALSGLHARAILYLVDEAGDMPPAVLRAAEQGLGNCQWGKILMAGNPTSHEGALYTAVSAQSHLWHVIRINGDPQDPKRSPRISLEWAAEQISLYGRENPWVMAYILGQFPPSSINALLAPDEVRAAMGRHLREDQYSWSQKRLGIDCARFGDDRTVIFPRQGLASHHPTVLRDARGTEIAAKVMAIKNEWGSELETLDDTGGWGQSTIDTLIAAGHSPVGVQFHSPRTNDPRYANRRAEMWMEMAAWVKRGGVLPNIPELVGELTIPTYSFNGAGKFLIEPKDAVKKRLGRSPDLADALALTFAMPEMAAADTRLVGAGGRGMVSDYDPYAASEA
jgi:phage terminase large subunit